MGKAAVAALPTHQHRKKLTSANIKHIFSIWVMDDECDLFIEQWWWKVKWIEHTLDSIDMCSFLSYTPSPSHSLGFSRCLATFRWYEYKNVCINTAGTAVLCVFQFDTCYFVPSKNKCIVYLVWSCAKSWTPKTKPFHLFQLFVNFMLFCSQLIRCVCVHFFVVIKQKLQKYEKKSTNHVKWITPAEYLLAPFSFIYHFLSTTTLKWMVIVNKKKCCSLTLLAAVMIFW